MILLVETLELLQSVKMENTEFKENFQNITVIHAQGETSRVIVETGRENIIIDKAGSCREKQSRIIQYALVYNIYIRIYIESKSN